MSQEPSCRFSDRRHGGSGVTTTARPDKARLTRACLEVMKLHREGTSELGKGWCNDCQARPYPCPTYQAASCDGLLRPKEDMR